jgi:hypothetical protein
LFPEAPGPTAAHDSHRGLMPERAKAVEACGDDRLRKWNTVTYLLPSPISGMQRVISPMHESEAIAESREGLTPEFQPRSARWLA